MAGPLRGGQSAQRASVRGQCRGASVAMRETPDGTKMWRGSWAIDELEVDGCANVTIRPKNTPMIPAAPRAQIVAPRSLIATSSRRFSCHSFGRVDFLFMSDSEHLSEPVTRAILTHLLHEAPCVHRLFVAGCCAFVCQRLLWQEPVHAAEALQWPRWLHRSRQWRPSIRRRAGPGSRRALHPSLLRCTLGSRYAYPCQCAATARHSRAR